MSNKETAIAKKKETIKELLIRKQTDIKQLLPTHINIDRFIKSALLAVARNDKLQKCTKESVFTGVVNAAELGLDFTPAKGHAYLIPYGDQATFMPGYRGLIDLAKRSGTIAKIEAHIVHENDKFILEYGLEPKLIHKPIIKGDTGEIIGAYAIAWFKGEDPQYEFMTKKQLDGIRKRAKTDTIWKSDEGEMCRKTPVRRLFKYLPCSPDLEKALEYDNHIAGVIDAPEDNGLSRTENLANLIITNPTPTDVDAKTGEVIESPDTSKETEPMTNPKTSGMINSICSKEYALDPEQTLKLISAIIKHDITKMKQLTLKEVEWVTETLNHRETIDGFLAEINSQKQ